MKSTNIEIDSLDILQELFGINDKLIKVIENRLGVSITQRNSCITVSGTNDGRIHSAVNIIEAMKEALADIDEGADIIMVKPAMIYGDLIREIKDRTNVPMAAYSVSGEYAMIKGAASLGLIDEDAIICETAIAAKRAGADIYLTYFAQELAGFIKDGRL